MRPLKPLNEHARRPCGGFPDKDETEKGEDPASTIEARTHVLLPALHFRVVRRFRLCPRMIDGSDTNRAIVVGLVVNFPDTLANRSVKTG